MRADRVGNRAEAQCSSVGGVSVLSFGPPLQRRWHEAIGIGRSSCQHRRVPSCCPAILRHDRSGHSSFDLGLLNDVSIEPVEVCGAPTLPVFSITGITLNQEGDAFGVHFMNCFLDLIGFDIDPQLRRTSNRLPETG